MERENCMFRKVEILPHNIGYLKLDFFPDTSVCLQTATSAMASLNTADAIIFDLRDNRGGFEDMVLLLAGYLFDHPEYIYSPRHAPTAESWTRSLSQEQAGRQAGICANVGLDLVWRRAVQL